METDCPLEVGFKADLTLKMEIEIEFARIPVILENERASGMEIGIFEVVSKTYTVKLISCNGAFCEKEGNGLNGL